MAMDVTGMNTMISRIQMQNAQQVVQSNIGALKHDELKHAVGEEEHQEPVETLDLSAAAEPSTDQELASAENSGDLSQVDPQLKNRDSDRVERGAERARHLAEQEGSAGESVEQAGQKTDTVRAELDSGDRAPRQTQEEIIHAALADVPDDIKKVSGEMVTNQLQGTQAAPSLARLHNIPEPAMKDLTAAPMLAEPLDIHDQGNVPVQHPIEETAAATEQAKR